jgi:hypothetical protein
MPERFSKRSWVLSLGGISVLLLLGVTIIARSYVAHNALNVDGSGKVSTCVSSVLNRLNPTQIVDIALLDHVHRMCYQQIAEEDTLTDFGIRKSAFLNQQLQTPVMLWMVVAVTLSGVCLAGLQLLAAYRLASPGSGAFEQGGQLSIENSRISLKSSVTGVVILTLSLAFFSVFVTKVYPLTEVNSASGSLVLPPNSQAANTPQNQSPAANFAPSPQPTSIVPNAMAQPYPFPGTQSRTTPSITTGPTLPKPVGSSPRSSGRHSRQPKVAKSQQASPCKDLSGAAQPEQ